MPGPCQSLQPHCLICCSTAFRRLCGRRNGTATSSSLPDSIPSLVVSPSNLVAHSPVAMSGVPLSHTGRLAGSSACCIYITTGTSNLFPPRLPPKHVVSALDFRESRTKGNNGNMCHPLNLAIPPLDSSSLRFGEKGPPARGVERSGHRTLCLAAGDIVTLTSGGY